MNTHSEINSVHLQSAINNSLIDKNMINDEYIKKHKLLECLQEFKGATKTGNSAKEREKSLEEPFKLLAKKMLHGGYFTVVDEKDEELYKIELRSIEFYYHEEENYTETNRILDPIVYHKNTPSSKKKDAFRTGTLNTHVSGIDITFEDQIDARYRASALIRTFYYIGKDGKKELIKHPTKLYDYLFMKRPLPEIHIKWIDIKDVDYEHSKLYYGQRINVFDYQNGKRTEIIDPRNWGFSKEKITITGSPAKFRGYAFN